MARLAPAACSVRAMVAPTRFAPPVINTVLPVRLPLATGHFMTSAASVTTLPPLNAAEHAHAERVAAHIRAFMSAQGGAIGFDTYMRLALYAPGLGYYSAGATKLGGAGDFVTAPEVSSLFSRCLARQAADILAETGGDILELGAGLGTMAADLLTELAALDRLPGRYRILEVSADLAARQRERIARLPARIAERVEWLDRWPAQAMRGVVLANEVLDAMPVARFVLRGQQVRAQVVRGMGVRAAGDAFEWCELDPDPELRNAVHGILE